MRYLSPLAAAALGLALTLTGAVRADDVGKKMTDPVSNKEITVAKETPSVAVNGKRLYFTDAKNREVFLKAPETYLKTPLECPIKGFKGRANKANRLVVNDGLVYFCCSNCPAEFQKDPSILGKVTDPVSGKEFSLAADSPKATYKSGLYYFESDANKAEFQKDAAKYAKVTLP